MAGGRDGPGPGAVENEKSGGKFDSLQVRGIVPVAVRTVAEPSADLFSSDGPTDLGANSDEPTAFFLI
jgi:hypothetical protein